MDRFGDSPPDIAKLKPIHLKSAHPLHPWSMVSVPIRMGLSIDGSVIMSIKVKVGSGDETEHHKGLN